MSEQGGQIGIVTPVKYDKSGIDRYSSVTRWRIDRIRMTTDPIIRLVNGDVMFPVQQPRGRHASDAGSNHCDIVSPYRLKTDGVQNLTPSDIVLPLITYPTSTYVAKSRLDHGFQIFLKASDPTVYTHRIRGMEHVTPLHHAESLPGDSTLHNASGGM